MAGRLKGRWGRLRLLSAGPFVVKPGLGLLVVLSFGGYERRLLLGVVPQPSVGPASRCNMEPNYSDAAEAAAAGTQFGAILRLQRALQTRTSRQRRRRSHAIKKAPKKSTTS
jgi:hypothetical protein